MNNLLNFLESHLKSTSVSLIGSATLGITQCRSSCKAFTSTSSPVFCRYRNNSIVDLLLSVSQFLRRRNNVFHVTVNIAFGVRSGIGWYERLVFDLRCFNYSWNLVVIHTDWVRLPVKPHAVPLSVQTLVSVKSFSPRCRNRSRWMWMNRYSSAISNLTVYHKKKRILLLLYSK